jgi:hypothetical protein
MQPQGCGRLSATRAFRPLLMMVVPLSVRSVTQGRIFSRKICCHTAIVLTNTIRTKRRSIDANKNLEPVTQPAVLEVSGACKL